MRGSMRQNSWSPEVGQWRTNEFYACHNEERGLEFEGNGERAEDFKQALHSGSRAGHKSKVMPSRSGILYLLSARLPAPQQQSRPFLRPQRRCRKLLGWWLHWLPDVPTLLTRRTGSQCHYSAAAGLGPQSHSANRHLQRSLASARLVQLPPPQPSREPQTPVQFPSVASFLQQRRSDHVWALTRDTRSREAVALERLGWASRALRS
ncbi:hypothetical protein P7K49_023755 [Saguinus oedipus]|uniref:Uncharacterized protein n=1 Tax=Saguinus oedipus TaxID=9490 RepID=A0ABQ9UNB5_SAGOE|nr:hypothetical protein P7K49_023755 [Saguinus oedipus]